MHRGLLGKLFPMSRVHHHRVNGQFTSLCSVVHSLIQRWFFLLAPLKRGGIWYVVIICVEVEVADRATPWTDVTNIIIVTLASLKDLELQVLAWKWPWRVASFDWSKAVFNWRLVSAHRLANVGRVDGLRLSNYRRFICVEGHWWSNWAHLIRHPKGEVRRIVWHSQRVLALMMRHRYEICRSIWNVRHSFLCKWFLE